MLHLAALCFEWRIRLELLTVEICCLLKWRVFWKKKKKNRKKKEEKNINKLKLCLQTDLCLKGWIPLIWQISGDNGNYSKPAVSFQTFSEYKGKVHPAARWYTGCWVWRCKVINRCEANVWDPILSLAAAECSQFFSQAQRKHTNNGNRQEIRKKNHQSWPIKPV